ncbi:hypothetical protein CYV19_11490 [Natronobacterium gregoryi SP2]|uniref:Uncharacterized protein n=1 Tax=Natronobacterium gregoryi (strain ATCC 43098 / DSM 3393 / CCM 3738 / CIP 104747 / IAM 13177 / JCM 8860 / NBRC 102187 / NCIMB 2189 / SP2) TaxID=797304 RepID=L9XLX9_NATGS|nr:hypothetical protein C490_17082 [Natronobacterium gregoryi SP2]PLK20051.1 hypothetical protein CYV19_11490 [Natronobacterium gregoryi SP2]
MILPNRSRYEAGHEFAAVVSRRSESGDCLRPVPVTATTTGVPFVFPKAATGRREPSPFYPSGRPTNV